MAIGVQARSVMTGAVLFTLGVAALLSGGCEMASTVRPVAAAAPVAPGATTTPTVSSFSTEPTLPVPNVCGMDALDALNTLKGAGLHFLIDWDGTLTAPARRVVTQDPPAGSVVTTGTRVTLAVSTGITQPSSTSGSTGSDSSEAGTYVPITYFQAASPYKAGFRSQGMRTTKRLWIDSGYIVGEVRTYGTAPVSLYLIDSRGRRTLLYSARSVGGDWKTESAVNLMIPAGWYRFHVYAGTDTAWEVRYGSIWLEDLLPQPDLLPPPTSPEPTYYPPPSDPASGSATAPGTP